MNNLVEKRRGTYGVSYLKFQREWEYEEDHDKPKQVLNGHLQFPFLGIPTKQPQPNGNINSVQKMTRDTVIPVRTAHT
jgi:hypothetical protein